MRIEIPENAEVQRLRLEPGDRLVVRVPARISMALAEATEKAVRAGLGLGEDFPVLVLADGISLEVVSAP